MIFLSPVATSHLASQSSVAQDGFANGQQSPVSYPILEDGGWCPDLAAQTSEAHMRVLWECRLFLLSSDDHPLELHLPSSVSSKGQEERT